MLDLRQLTYFVAVVEAKSFTAAADVLRVAQPALSQHLQRLEQELGQQLLVRHSRGIEPTDAGLRLLEHARSILTSVETARHDVQTFSEHSRGHVRLGMPRSLSDALGVELMSTWPKEYPNINLQIVEQLSNTLTEWVIAGRLDLALTSSPSDSNMVVAEPLLQEKLCIVAPATRDSHGLGETHFTELAHHPLILPSSAYVTRQLIDMTAKYCSVPLNIAYEIDSLDLTLSMVEANLGWTVQPYLTARRHMETGRASGRLIIDPGVTRRVHLIHSRHRPPTPDEVRVRKTIRDLLGQYFGHDKYRPMIELDMRPEASSDNE